MASYNQNHMKTQTLAKSSDFASYNLPCPAWNSKVSQHEDTGRMTIFHPYITIVPFNHTANSSFKKTSQTVQCHDM